MPMPASAAMRTMSNAERWGGGGVAFPCAFTVAAFAAAVFPAVDLGWMNTVLLVFLTIASRWRLRRSMIGITSKIRGCLLVERRSVASLKGCEGCQPE